MQQDLENSGDNRDSQMDVYGRSVKGGAWLIGLRGFMFLLNFIRLPILLRLLVPYDFGLFHISVLMTGMVGSFTNFGLQSALIQRKHNTDTHLNVVWTVGILRGLVLFGILFFKSFSSTIMKVQGCELQAEGASLAASRQRNNLSFSTGVSKYALLL